MENLKQLSKLQLINLILRFDRYNCELEQAIKNFRKLIIKPLQDDIKKDSDDS